MSKRLAAAAQTPAVPLAEAPAAPAAAAPQAVPKEEPSAHALQEAAPTTLAAEVPADGAAPEPADGFAGPLETQPPVTASVPAAPTPTASVPAASTPTASVPAATAAAEEAPVAGALASLELDASEPPAAEEELTWDQLLAPDAGSDMQAMQAAQAGPAKHASSEEEGGAVVPMSASLQEGLLA